MNESLKIAIVGFSTIEAFGLRHLFEEQRCCHTENFRQFRDFETLSERMEGYVVSAECFVENLEFFLPRKGRIMIVRSGIGETSHRDGLTEIFSEDDESETKRRIEIFLRSLKGNEQPGELSSREVEVLRLIARGKINKEIADELCISVNTVITHRKNISAKLGVKSVSGLSLYAMMNGLI